MKRYGLNRIESQRARASYRVGSSRCGFGGAIDLVSDPAKVTSANSSALLDYERYDGIGLAELVKARGRQRAALAETK